MIIDPVYDFRFDSGGKDPDLHSLTLKNYHKFIWSKKSPYGFEAQVIENPNGYLSFLVSGQKFPVSSDSISNSLRSYSRTKEIMQAFPDELINQFIESGSKIGGYIIFPSNRIAGKMTINGARGFNNRICDRFDLTLECIRLFYIDKSNPLSTVLENNSTQRIPSSQWNCLGQVLPKHQN